MAPCPRLEPRVRLAAGHPLALSAQDSRFSRPYRQVLCVEELHQRDSVLAGGADQTLVGLCIERFVLAQMSDDALPELVHRGAVEPEVAGCADQRALPFQMGDHSPQRLETITSFYKHPIELVMNGVLSSFVLYVLCGLSLAPAALAVLLTGVAELFYHWNVRTPHWLGFLVQRPESHCRHHEGTGQPLNYSDLPLWDWSQKNNRPDKPSRFVDGISRGNRY